jgi:hypothetical protein
VKIVLDTGLMVYVKFATIQLNDLICALKFTTAYRAVPCFIKEEGAEPFFLTLQENVMALDYCFSFLW